VHRPSKTLSPIPKKLNRIHRYSREAHKTLEFGSPLHPTTPQSLDATSLIPTRKEIITFLFHRRKNV